MRGTGQPLCSQTRTATCCSTCAALELWLLLQLNSLLRVPYVRMQFRLSDQDSWVVASHKAGLSGLDLARTWSTPRRSGCSVREVGRGAAVAQALASLRGRGAAAAARAHGQAPWLTRM